MNEQLILMEQCKARLGNRSLATELSDLLGVTTDAAYRRMRGDTSLTFDEIQKICRHFNVSFDSIINYGGKLVPFQFNAMFGANFSMMDYLKTIDAELKALGSLEGNHLVMTAMDLPYFRQFGFPSLSNFKMFFWQRSVLNLPSFRHRRFDATESMPEFEEITRSMYNDYHRVDSVEIWAPETLDSTIKQIRYYADSGLFTNKETSVMICEDLHRLLNKLEDEAERGQKSVVVNGELVSSPFKMYQSDIYMSNNCIQGYYGDKVYTYVSFNTFNSLMSFTPNFSAECTRWIEQIRLKSILLSEVSEKLRYQFFKRLHEKVDQLSSEINV